MGRKSAYRWFKTLKREAAAGVDHHKLMNSISLRTHIYQIPMMKYVLIKTK